MSLKDRNNRVVALGRIYQLVSPAWWFIDYFFRGGKKWENFPAVFVIGPPRSGSTLMYQVLNNVFENNHLTNIWNLLYSTPAIGARISHRLCKDHVASYQSMKGFVPGFCGEAEGMKFWKYWTGQGLEERPERLKERKTKKLVRILSGPANPGSKPFFSGYIGHAFTISFLRKHFPKALFIYMQRDLISNAYSIYRLFPEQWFSLKPQGINEQEDRYNQIASQLILIHQKILASLQHDIVPVSYESLCQNPQQVVNQIKQVAQKNGIELALKHKLPSQFKVSKVKEDENEDVRRLKKALEEKVKLVEPEHASVLNNLLSY
jgi:hypothetical protein